MKVSCEYFEAIRTGVTVVTPTGRVSRLLATAYNAQMRETGAPVWPTPDIVSWAGWIGRLYEGVVIGDLGAPGVEASFLLNHEQERILWEKVVGDREDHDAAHTGRLAGLAMDAWAKMHDWQLDPADVFRPPLSPGVDAFECWSRGFTAACDACHGIDYARATVALAEGGREALRPMAGPVVLRGFTQQSPLAEKLIEVLASAGFEFSRLDEVHLPRGPLFKRFVSVEEEIRAAAHWGRDLALNNPHASIAVAVSELDRLRSAVRQTFTEVMAPASHLLDHLVAPKLFQISGEGLLAEEPLIRSALAILTLSSRCKWQQVSALLRSPFLGEGETERHERALLDAKLREGQSVELSLDRLVALAEQAGFPCADFARRIKAIRDIRANAPRRQSLNAWVVSISRMLEAAGWPGGAALSEVEQTVFDTWRRVLESLAGLDAVLGSVSNDRAIKELQAMLRDSHSDDLPLATVQVVTPEEAVALRPAYLWVVGVHDGAWPLRRGPNPLLPYRLQRIAGIPGADPQAGTERTRALFDVFADSACGSVFSYSLAENDMPLRPSSLLPGLWSAPIERCRPEQAAVWRPRQNISLESVDDSDGPPMGRPKPFRGGVSVFADQAACPFRGFARHRLGAWSIEDPTPGLDPRKRGELVHRMLEKFWKTVASQRALRELSDTALRAHAAACVDRAIASMAGRLDLGPRFWDIERERLADLLFEFLGLDRDRPSFEVIATELPQVLRYGGIEINVRIDRIDRLDDGSEVLIDYKTGGAGRNDWAAPRPDRPQLPLYALNRAGSPVAGIAYARIRKGEPAYIDEPAGILAGAASDAQATSSWRETLDGWRREMDVIAHEARAGHAAVAPKSGAKTCKYCDLHVLCRVHELRGAIAQTTESDD